MHMGCMSLDSKYIAYDQTYKDLSRRGLVRERFHLLFHLFTFPSVINQFMFRHELHVRIYFIISIVFRKIRQKLALLSVFCQPPCYFHAYAFNSNDSSSAYKLW